MKIGTPSKRASPSPPATSFSTRVSISGRRSAGRRGAAARNGRRRRPRARLGGPGTRRRAGSRRGRSESGVPDRAGDPERPFGRPRRAVGPRRAGRAVAAREGPRAGAVRPPVCGGRPGGGPGGGSGPASPRSSLRTGPRHHLRRLGGPTPRRPAASAVAPGDRRAGPARTLGPDGLRASRPSEAGAGRRPRAGGGRLRRAAGARLSAAWAGRRPRAWAGRRRAAAPTVCRAWVRVRRRPVLLVVLSSSLSLHQDMNPGRQLRQAPVDLGPQLLDPEPAGEVMQDDAPRCGSRPRAARCRPGGGA